MTWSHGFQRIEHTRGSAAKVQNSRERSESAFNGKRKCVQRHEKERASAMDGTGIPGSERGSRWWCSRWSARPRGTPSPRSRTCPGTDGGSAGQFRLGWLRLRSMVLIHSFHHVIQGRRRGCHVCGVARCYSVRHYFSPHANHECAGGDSPCQQQQRPCNPTTTTTMQSNNNNNNNQTTTTTTTTKHQCNQPCN